jgi:4-amino-4-deoxy-L-arabinose transferase-like glycosyltransferase
MEGATASAAPARARAAALVLLVLLLAAVLWSRAASQRETYHMMDEAIAVAVVDRVLSERTLDSNWARTQVMPEFRYDQYNFSSYYLAAAAWLAVTGQADAADRLPPLRWLSALLHALAVALAAWLGWRWRGAPAAAIAALLTALSPTLWQDSLYARPEAFVTVLTLGFVLLLEGRVASARRLVAAGVLAGLLLACKISFALLVPLALLVRVSGREAPPLRPSELLGFGLAVGAGFALGAPYALLHPHEYLQGVAALLRQYGGGHLPHGLPQDGAALRLLFGLDYLRHTAGSALLLAVVVGALVLRRERGARTAWLVGGLALMLLYFLQTRAFFERNVSHVLPLLFALAGVGIAWLAERLSRPALRAAALLAATLLLLWVPARVSHTLVREALPGALAREAAHYESTLHAEGKVVVEFIPDQPDPPAAGLCGPVVLREVDWNHPYLRRQADRVLAEHGYELLRHLPGPFTDLPASTLHSYHGADVRYHERREPWPATCRVGLAPLPREATPLPAPPARLAGHAAVGGSATPAPAHWPAPLYGTHAGSDAHTGAIHLDAIRACGDFLLPVIAGYSHRAVRFTVGPAAPASAPWFDAAPPRVLGGWAALQLRHPGPGCADYAARGDDPSAGWSAWLGLGSPVAAPSPADSLPPTVPTS